MRVLEWGWRVLGWGVAAAALFCVVYGIGGGLGVLHLPAAAAISLVVALVLTRFVRAPRPPIPKEEMGIHMREMALKASPEELNIAPSAEYPRVYAVLMDWPAGAQIVTLLAGSHGDASLYSTTTFSVIGGVAHEAVRAAAMRLVKKGERHFDEAEPVSAYPYAEPGRIRFYLMAFEGKRVVDVAAADIVKPRDPYHPLFVDAQRVITELRRTVEQKDRAGDLPA